MLIFWTLFYSIAHFLLPSCVLIVFAPREASLFFIRFHYFYFQLNVDAGISNLLPCWDGNHFSPNWAVWCLCRQLNLLQIHLARGLIERVFLDYFSAELRWLFWVLLLFCSQFPWQLLRVGGTMNTFLINRKSKLKLSFRDKRSHQLELKKFLIWYLYISITCNENVQKYSILVMSILFVDTFLI